VVKLHLFVASTLDGAETQAIYSRNESLDLIYDRCLYPGPYLRTGSQGPGSRAANFQGRHIKKIEIAVWYAAKKGCPRERNLMEIYTENNVGTEFSRYDATGARRS